ncbi:MAG: FAD-binding domain-containing protein [Pseudomonadota bacterium]
MTKPAVQVVWFKRDLRVQDHRPLAAAAAAGPVLPLFIIEPAAWQQPDAAGRHWAFLSESLAALRRTLAELGQTLIIRVGPATDVLATLRDDYRISALWSHEETGNAWSYERDRAVAAWCQSLGIRWHEQPQHGVIRRLGRRDGWARRWDRFMGEEQTPAPQLQPLPPPAGRTLPAGRLPARASLGLPADPCPERQAGGRTAGLSNLASFLADRGTHYRTAMSSPAAGARACSRLSPYLAWGCLSMREVAQTTWDRQRALKADAANDNTERVQAFRASLKSFSGRLHWHCHFMQKLEDEPALEIRNLHPAYHGLRPATPDADRLAAWCAGETGLPFVDACMRSLKATGWLNFRMRAMLMAVASYHLWLDWRRPGEHLARCFTDYEPGIHWPQVQMQSGTTGINTVRIYNPVKQGKDQDPDGTFVRRWVPELAAIEDQWLQEPWQAPNAAAVLDRRYPRPVVDHLEAARTAKTQIYAVRWGADYRHAADAIQQKHGSRRSGIRPVSRSTRAGTSATARKAKKAAADSQIELPLKGGGGVPPGDRRGRGRTRRRET